MHTYNINTMNIAIFTLLLLSQQQNVILSQSWMIEQLRVKQWQRKKLLDDPQTIIRINKNWNNH